MFSMFGETHNKLFNNIVILVGFVSVLLMQQSD